MSNVFDRMDKHIIHGFLAALGVITAALDQKKLALGAPKTHNKLLADGTVVKEVIILFFQGGKDEPPNKVGELAIRTDLDKWDHVLGPIEEEMKDWSAAHPVFQTEARSKLAKLRGNLYEIIGSLRDGEPMKLEDIAEELQSYLDVSAQPYTKLSSLDFAKEALQTLSEDEKTEVLSNLLERAEYKDRARMLMKMLTGEERQEIIAAFSEKT